MRKLNNSCAWPAPQMRMCHWRLSWPSVVQVLLKSRPKGWPSEENFEFVEVDLYHPEKVSGDVLVQILWLSVDPYLRGRCECLLLGSCQAGQPVYVMCGYLACTIGASIGPDICQADVLPQWQVGRHTSSQKPSLKILLTAYCHAQDGRGNGLHKSL